MNTCFLKETQQDPICIHPLTPKHYKQWLLTQNKTCQQWVKQTDFKAQPGSYCLVPDATGQLQCVLLGIENNEDFWSFGALPHRLPLRIYTLSNIDFPSKAHYFRACLAWGLGSYQFSAYPTNTPKPIAQLLLTHDTSISSLNDWVESISLGRDWINMPANIMHPECLANTVKTIAREHAATYQAIVGKKLLKANYPAVYTVGQAGLYEPRIIELNWGDKNNPRLTLIGKGVCFDAGGLDIKSAAGMRLMKKDMSGAAHALTLSRLIMQEKLPVRLRLLIPAVENVISQQSYRPGDVIKTRAGLHVEIENTDAEGRLILCDALTAAVEEKPELIIDFASLTGAAGIALGTDIPACYSNKNSLALQLLAISQECHDPLWPMPLYQPYAKSLKSNIADCTNCSSQGFGGSITAALYLQKFVPDHIDWLHFDFSAWNFESRPGRPEGGEILTLRSVFQYLQQRFFSPTKSCAASTT